MTDLRIAQIYPVELGLTGDRGNVRALEVRAERRGVKVSVAKVGIGEPLPNDLDVIVIGNGPLSALRGVHDDFMGRASELAAHIDAGRAILTVGASAELLGERIDLMDGESLTGLGLMPYRVVRTRDRRVGYIVVETAAGRICGFEDHASEWILSDAGAAWGQVTAGHGTFDLAESRGEFVRRANSLAGNVQGPLLPLNPAMTDMILAVALEARGKALPDAGPGVLDEYAEAARAAIEALAPVKEYKTIGL